MRDAPYVIYEIANAHDGDLNRLLTLIERLGALDYPARGIKLHPIAAETLATPDFPHFDTYRRLAFSRPEWGTILEAAEAAIDDVWVEMACATCAAVFLEHRGRIAGVKFQASMVDNEETLSALREVDLSDHRALVNVSGYELDAALDAVAAIEALGFREVAIQMGFQFYPTAVADTAFNKIAAFQAVAPGRTLCFADHLDATDPFARRAPAVAAALGCAIIEKHCCLERSETEIDRASALEPAEIAEMQADLLKTAAAFSDRFVSPREAAYLEKSLIKPLTAAEHPAGRLLAPADLSFRRSSQEGLSYTEVKALQAARRVPARTLPANTPFRASDFRPAVVGAIVACRLKSSRLPRKAVLPIDGVPSVERCLENCLLFKGVDHVVLASSTHDDDAPLADYALGGRVPFRRGHPDDVIRRYLDVAEEFGIDVILRVTADCPTISPEMAELALEAHFREGADFTRPAREAVGAGVQVVSTEALRRVLALKGDALFSEYMNLYFENNPHHFRVARPEPPADLLREVRLTLDYPEDLEMYDELYAALRAQGRTATLRNVFSVLDERPDIARINAEIAPVYTIDHDLIAKLNRETRIDD